MKNGDIPDESISASAYRTGKSSRAVGRDVDFVPALARLDGIMYWSTSGSEVEPWIQADIGYQTYVSGIITQGCGDNNYRCYTTTLKVSTYATNVTSSEGKFITESGTTQPMVREQIFSLYVHHLPLSNHVFLAVFKRFTLL